MMKKAFRPAIAALLIPLIGGCAAGNAASGAVGSLFQMVLYLAMIAAPIALSYHLYGKD